MIRTATRFLRLIDLASGVVVSACMAVMVMVVSAQVFMRYVLNSSFDWADEVSRLAFVSAVFLAIPLGLREGAHVGITIVVQCMPPRLQDLLRRALCLVAAVMLVIVFYKAVSVASLTWSERMGVLQVTSSVFFMPIIFGLLHSALHLVLLAFGPPPPARSAMAQEGAGA